MFSRLTRLGLVALAALSVAPAALAAQRPTLDKDTPADVQKGSSNAVAELDKFIAKLTGDRSALVQRKAPASNLTMVDDQLIALKEARAAMARIAKDPALAGRVLDAARKKDHNTIIGIVKTDARQSAVEIVNIKDWTATFSFKVRGRNVTVCGSSESGCNGGTASVVVS